LDEKSSGFDKPSSAAAPSSQSDLY